LQNLNSEQLEPLKETFIKNDHPRFRREIAAIRHMPYGTSAVYQEGIRGASLEKLARLVKIVGMLLQTKVYLFWSKENYYNYGQLSQSKVISKADLVIVLP
jgi:hypothetical protein